MGVPALYRTGQSKTARSALRNILKGLKRFYPGIPDTDAISALLGLPYQRPDMPPLFLDGFIVFSNDESWLTLPLNVISWLP